MGLFNRDYDRDFGRRNRYGYGADRVGGRGWGYGRDYSGYGSDYRTVGLGYDEEFKSRWQTDYGDPFGDRQRRTPIRMMRGEWEDYGPDYGSDIRGRDRDWNVGRSQGWDRDRELGGQDWYSRQSRGGYSGHNFNRGEFYNRRPGGAFGYDSDWGVRRRRY